MAVLALILWPMVILALFAAMPVAKALVWSVVIGALFLPEEFGFDLQGFPTLDKASIPALAMIAATLFFAKKARPDPRSPGFQPGDVLVNASSRLGYLIILLIVLMLIGQVLTVMDNQFPIFISDERTLPALRPWDIVSAVARTVFLLVPFVLARRYLATPETHKIVLQVLVIMGLVYSILVLFEVRMSPQLNSWIYGYFQHSFLQHIRGGGYRPIVFLPHGLWVGFFLFSVVIAACALIRIAPDKDRVKLILAAGFLFVVLGLSKNLAATLLAMMFAPLLLLAAPKWQIRLVTLVALLLLTFPALRQANLVPVQTLAGAATAISPDRGQSLQFRFDNEDQLLERALLKPVSGWGGWGRGRIYDHRGNDLSTIDGMWIVQMGQYGWLGYVSFFGLLTAPILLLRRASKRKEVPIETLALALIMAGNFIYLIPNSTLSPIGWMIAGALAGFVQFDRATETSVAPAPKRRRATPVDDPPPEMPTQPAAAGPRYSRFSGASQARAPSNNAARRRSARG